MQTKTPPPRLSYRISEAARATGLSRSTLYSLIQAGRLHSVKVGKARLIPADEVARIVAGSV